jgi:hypothetical protein
MIMNSEKSNFSALLLIAFAAGIIQATAGVFMYVSGVYFAPWSMAISAVVLLICIVGGIKLYRDKYTSGSFSYANALLAGAVISVGTGIVYAVYNLISINFFYPNFLDQLARSYSALGAGSVESVRANVSAVTVAIPNLIRLSVLGIVISAVVAIFLRRANAPS